MSVHYLQVSSSLHYDIVVLSLVTAKLSLRYHGVYGAFWYYVVFGKFMYPTLASTVARNQKCLDYSIPFISLFHFPIFWKALNTEEYNAIYVKANSCRQISLNCVSVFLYNNTNNYFFFHFTPSLPFHKVTSLLIPILYCKNAAL